MRKSLLESPEKFGIDLGKAPASRIQLYENNGLIPKCITIGGSGRGKMRTGYWPEVVLEMIKEIQFLQREHKFPGIRKIFDEKYRRVFELMDLVKIFRLRYLDENLLETYLDNSALTLTQKRKVQELYQKDLAYKEIKLSILDILAGINIKSEIAQ